MASLTTLTDAIKQISAAPGPSARRLHGPVLTGCAITRRGVALAVGAIPAALLLYTLLLIPLHTEHQRHPQGYRRASGAGAICQ